jgi:hypothetical protein
MTCIPTKLRTEHLPNTILDRYHYAESFGPNSFDEDVNNNTSVQARKFVTVVTIVAVVTVAYNCCCGYRWC